MKVDAGKRAVTESWASENLPHSGGEADVLLVMQQPEFAFVVFIVVGENLGRSKARWPENQRMSYDRETR